MYRVWVADPSSVHPSWDAYFRTGEFTAPAYSSPSSGETSKVTAPTGNVGLAQLIRAFQVRGHFHAKLDPLNVNRIPGEDRKLVDPNELDPSNYGITTADLSEPVGNVTSSSAGFGQVTGIPLGQLIDRLKDTYTGSIGAEYMHIPHVEQCNFIRERLETVTPHVFSKADKALILDRLTWADHFERFLAYKYSTAKRFGLEGAESLIPGMKSMIDTSCRLGVEDVVIGMPHRGRLNVLSTVVRKPLESIFKEFVGLNEVDAQSSATADDVKYHLGMSFNRPSVDLDKNIHLSLLANPSHLEAVNPVVVGKTKAKQFWNHGGDTSKVLPILMHGDSAFAGQGIVYETMGFQELDGYKVGGTIHLVVNNQIGFTTDPVENRSTAYCTDLAKAFSAPVFHVNGDDVEAVVRVCNIAAEWRSRFQKDVVIDLVCYRKYGHNEIDEPMFTQPHMYKLIHQHKSPLEIYAAKLAAEGMEQDTIDASDKVNRILAEKFEEAKNFEIEEQTLQGNWLGQSSCKDDAMPDTYKAATKDQVDEVFAALTSLPKDFTLHKRLQNIFKAKVKAFAEHSMDWATAEALAFGTLLLDGFHVRLSGQDVERGTFSHRHAVLHDQVVDRALHIPLAGLSPTKDMFTVVNSSLSEFGVLGFDYGYSIEHPQQLVVWEAQFGDFANGAQVIVDQFLSSAEVKWLRQSGLVMLLPHGYEGMGPEHSSCRIERYLQLCNEDEDTFPGSREEVLAQAQSSNVQICNVTTPANYFHVLRRQVLRPFRKPLIIATPKSLLRHKKAVSSPSELVGDSKFQRLIPEHEALDQVRRVIFCSGKVYYDLLAHREQTGDKTVAIARVEQISPFPFDKVAHECARYPDAEVVWTQEEPKNQGPWFYTGARINTALRHSKGDTRRVRYIGRDVSASTATGHGLIHKQQQTQLVHESFEGVSK